jgi:hypothetical protein
MSFSRQPYFFNQIAFRFIKSENTGSPAALKVCWRATGKAILGG